MLKIILVLLFITSFLFCHLLYFEYEFQWWCTNLQYVRKMQPQRNAASIVNTVFEIHDFDEVTDDVS